jgi:hypothetical protein
MATLNIGGKRVKVDDAFLQMTPEQQQATVDEIAASIGVGGDAGADAEANASRMSQSLQGGPGPRPTSGNKVLDIYNKHGIPGSPLLAAGDRMLDAIPIAGPTVRDFMQGVRGDLSGMFGGPSREEMDATTARAVKGEPGAAAAGSVVGTTAPLVAGGMLPGISRLLGVTGGLPSQAIFGGLSGAAITGADTMARGGTPEQAAGNAAIGGGLGAVAPWLGPVASRLFGGKTAVGPDARNIARALKDDQIPPAEIRQRLDAMGPDAMLMDLGPNLQRQAGALASVPGMAQKQVRQAVADRAKRAGTRVAGDVAATIGSGPDIDALKQNVVAQQSAAAKPLYDSIRDLPLPAQGGNFFHVFATPLGKEALQTGIQMAANDGVRFQSSGLTVGMVDYAKRALDDIAQSAARAGNNNKARQAANLARTLRDEADKLVPEYAQARAAFAGPAAVLDAIDQGQAVFSKDMSPMQLQSALNQMGQGERDAFIQGARAAVEAQMGNAVNDVASLRNMFRRGYNEQKLRILLGNDIADDLMKRVERELTYGSTTSVVSGNSETAARQAAQLEVAPGMQKLRPEGIVGLVFKAFDAARAGVRGKAQPKVNARMAAALASGAGQFDPAVLQQISRASQPKTVVPLPAAAPALLGTEPNRRPLEITVPY